MGNLYSVMCPGLPFIIPGIQKQTYKRRRYMYTVSSDESDGEEPDEEEEEEEEHVAKAEEEMLIKEEVVKGKKLLKQVVNKKILKKETVKFLDDTDTDMTDDEFCVKDNVIITEAMVLVPSGREKDEHEKLSVQEQDSGHHSYEVSIKLKLKAQIYCVLSSVALFLFWNGRLCIKNMLVH